MPKSARNSRRPWRKAIFPPLMLSCLLFWGTCKPRIVHEPVLIGSGRVVANGRRGQPNAVRKGGRLRQVGRPGPGRPEWPRRRGRRTDGEPGERRAESQRGAGRGQSGGGEGGDPDEDIRLHHGDERRGGDAGRGGRTSDRAGKLHGREAGRAERRCQGAHGRGLRDEGYLRAAVVDLREKILRVAREDNQRRDGGGLMELRRVPISEVVPWDKNPRGILKADFERLKRQIKRLGVYKPLVVCEDGGKKGGRRLVVLGGNMRLLALRELGIKEIEVSVVRAPTDKERIDYSLSDNDRAGYYEEEALAELVYPHLQEINLEDFKVGLGKMVDLKDVVERYGPDIDDGAEDGPEIDDTPAGTKTGDLFTLGKHRVR